MDTRDNVLHQDEEMMESEFEEWQCLVIIHVSSFSLDSSTHGYGGATSG
jgi:hypothetical protein